MTPTKAPPPTRSDEPPLEPPQVVEHTEAPAADATSPVDAYVARIEQALAERRVAATQPAAPPPIVVPTASVEAPPVVIVPEPVAAPTPAPEPAPTTPSSPPVLMNAAVRAGGARLDGEPSVATPSPNRPTAAHSSGPTVDDVLRELKLPENAGFNEQLDARMLAVLAGDYLQARKPLELVSDEEQTLAASLVETLITIREAQLGNDDDIEQLVAERLPPLRRAVRALSGVRVPSVAICSAVRGFGQYEPIEPARFVAGQANEFVVYVEVQDFVSEKRSDGWYHTQFDLTTSFLNRSGETVYSLSDTDIADRCRNERQDCFIPRLVKLPASLAPGEYVAKVTVSDKLGNRVAQAHTAFELVARP